MNIGKKKGLGRGLSALFGDSTPKEKLQVSNNNMVAIADLSRNPYQQDRILKRKNLKN